MMRKPASSLRMTVSAFALLLTFGVPGIASAAPRSLGSVQVASNDAAPASDDGIPTLVVTNRKMSDVLPDVGTGNAQPGTDGLKPDVPGLASTADTGIYKSMMTEAPQISPEAVLGKDYFNQTDTTAAKKIDEIREEMFSLQSRVDELSSKLASDQQVGQELAANYYAAVATINTQLQSGTTPGNPRLEERLKTASDALETLSGNVSDLNALALEISDAASTANFLQQSARAAYGLTGSVEEDYARLAQLEDSVSNTAVLIERLLNNVNDDITRSAAYLSSERSNMRTLSLAIANGDMYGRSLSNRPFMAVAQSTISADMAAANAGQAGMQPASLGGPVPAPVASGNVPGPRPLVTVRFDRPDVDFQQAVYQSVSEALERYPNARFELVAVSPGAGNPARKAIESTRARRNAEKVLRTLTQMGLGSERIDLSAMTNDNIQTNEVHIYIR